MVLNEAKESELLYVSHPEWSKSFMAVLELFTWLAYVLLSRMILHR
jgi:hypothetical protein